MSCLARHFSSIGLYSALKILPTDRRDESHATLCRCMLGRKLFGNGIKYPLLRLAHFPEWLLLLPADNCRSFGPLEYADLRLTWSDGRALDSSPLLCRASRGGWRFQ